MGSINIASLYNVTCDPNTSVSLPIDGGRAALLVSVDTHNMQYQLHKPGSTRQAAYIVYIWWTSTETINSNCDGVAHMMVC
jgi:hypothetical protein